jgi:hypothetical protein
MIEQLRAEFRSIRASLNANARRDWDKLEAKLSELETPPTPLEWVQQIKRFADERRLKGALKKWQTNRLDHAWGWGENLDPSQIKGWDDALSTVEKSLLLERQYKADLDTQWAYEDWRADRDW